MFQSGFQITIHYPCYFAFPPGGCEIDIQDDLVREAPATIRAPTSLLILGDPHTHTNYAAYNIENVTCAHCIHAGQRVESCQCNKFLNDHEYSVRGSVIIIFVLCTEKMHLNYSLFSM